MGSELMQINNHLLMFYLFKYECKDTSTRCNFKINLNKKMRKAKYCDVIFLGSSDSDTYCVVKTTFSNKYM